MSRTSPAHRSLPHQVRIIGGQWKRTKLDVPDRPGLRPTPDRVRETLFNWLGQDLTGWRCVDAFAGSGALGLEAASRGAADVLLVEADGALPPASVDLVFLDPPFDADLFDKALAAAVPALQPQGWIYLEAPTPWQGEALARHGLEGVRHLKAGAVHGHLLRPVA